MSSWEVAQAWINTAGLGLDFLGVLLLAFEWRTAMRHEAHEAEVAQREELVRPRPGLPTPAGPHHEMHQDFKERQRFRERANRAAAARTQRRGWFVASLVLIAVGFLLQMIGSLPGGLIAV